MLRHLSGVRLYDHIDLRVNKLSEVNEFYRALLPALGFTHLIPMEGWLQYEAEVPEKGVEGAAFFGVTESADHQPNENRIAFWASSRRDVDRLGELVSRIGGRKMEGPMDYETGYYAVFFEDPCGNRFEVCHRT